MTSSKLGSDLPPSFWIVDTGIIVGFWFGGRPPFILRAFPSFSLAPRAPPLGDLAGPTHYPEGSPRDNFLQSVERSGVSTGITWFWWFVRWFWFGVVRFPGVSAPGSFFFLVFPWKPFHKAKQYVQILKQARCIATEHTGAGPISSAARTILPSSSG